MALTKIWLGLSLTILVAGLYWGDVFSSYVNLDASVASTSSVSAHVATMASVARGDVSQMPDKLKPARSLPSHSGVKSVSSTSVTISSPGRSSVTAQTSSSASPTHPKPKEDIFAAAAAGRWQDVSKFLKAGSEPTLRDSQLFTPLHHAAASGNKKTIDLLLKFGKTGWFADDHVTPVHLAARYGHTAAVKQILEKFPELEKEQAVAPQAIQTLKESLKHRFDDKLDSFFRRKTFTARELAAIYGHQSTVFAFSYGANDGLLNALSCACLMGDAKMVQALWNNHKARWWIDRTSGPAKQVSGYPAPPLHLAVMSGDRPTVAFLLEEGLSTKVESSRSSKAYPAYSPAAHFAATVGSVELMKTLERGGADVTALDHRSRTPLSYAVESLNVDMVEFLLESKHPDRGPSLFGSRIMNKWLGSGHVWPSKEASVVAGSRHRSVAKALKRVGLIAQ